MDPLERLHQRVVSGRESADALQRQSAQAARRARQLFAEATRLNADAEGLVADARANHAEHVSLMAKD